MCQRAREDGSLFGGLASRAQLGSLLFINMQLTNTTQRLNQGRAFWVWKAAKIASLLPHSRQALGDHELPAVGGWGGEAVRGAECLIQATVGRQG